MLRKSEVDDKRFSEALNTLVDSNFLSYKENGKYEISDLILKEMDFLPLSKRV